MIWSSQTRLRRPLWYARPYKPTPEMFVLAEEEPEEELAPAGYVAPSGYSEGLSGSRREPLRLIERVS